MGLKNRMSLSLEGLKFIQFWEGFEDEAYLDTGGVWTIGYGTTKINGKRVTKGMTCTPEQASVWLAHDVKWAEASVNDSVDVEINQNQFDALVSFTYNVGETAFETSTLLRKLNANDYIEAANQLLRWKYDNGRVIKGLLNRREAEKKVFEAVDQVDTLMNILETYLKGYNIPKTSILTLHDMIQDHIDNIKN